jgi:hypothetical protein
MTAVEWLIEHLNLDETSPNYNKLIMKQAKEMEKQQIIDAHGDKLKKSSGTTNFEYWFSGEDYYKKQFNK